MFAVRIEVPGQKPILENDHVSLRAVLTRMTAYGPMRFVNTGEVKDGATVFRVPAPLPKAELDPIWNGGELLDDREEETNPVYLFGDASETSTGFRSLGSTSGARENAA